VATERISYSAETVLSLSNLKFYHEKSSILNYQLTTKIEYPHGICVNGIIYFFSKIKNLDQFITFGSDKKFKIWQLFEKERLISIKEEKIT